MKQHFLILLFLGLLNTVFAQPHKTIKKYKPYKWMIGASWTAIDDDGRKFAGLFDYSKSWNILPYPSKISVDRYLKHGWSIEGSATYSEYKLGKMVQCSTDVSSILASFDINAKHSFYTYYAPRHRWIEPYFSMGIGYTYRSSARVAEHVPTVNLGFGLNFWFSKNIGIQLHSHGKLGVYPGFWDSHTSYFQHSAGLLFRWQNKKTKKSDFKRKKNKWAHGNKGYKRKGGH
ncbi:MAG: hypothetical protein MK105_09195 [Crocinitomicaceae bacterium]|nr:hypothetical protein [Crocinitomicaceae bacterium]